MSEDFMLKWNDHHSLFFVGAEELCESEEYTDVTLAAGTKLFAAHKLILSICSPYFRQLFRSMGKEKTVIYLKDVEPRHLDLLLQYMYKGEIKVKESELVSVLQVAQGLDIKGLSEQGGPVGGGQGHPHPHPQHKQHVERQEVLVKHPTKRVSPAESSSTEPNTAEPVIRKKARTPPLPADNFAPLLQPPTLPGMEGVDVKRELTPVTIDLDGSDQGGSMSGFDGLSQEMAFIDTSVSTSFEGEVSYEDGQYYEEAMGHHSDRGFEGTKNCPYCLKEFHNSSSLRQHLPVHTKEKNYTCTYCEACYTRSSNLYAHVRLKHPGIVQNKVLKNTQ
jgi:uncharacterized Zn-finger protein